MDGWDGVRGWFRLNERVGERMGSSTFQRAMSSTYSNLFSSVTVLFSPSRHRGTVPPIMTSMWYFVIEVGWLLLWVREVYHSISR